MTQRDEDPEFNWWLVLGAGLCGVVLVGGAAYAPGLMHAPGIGAMLPFGPGEANAQPIHPFAELLKLVVAGLIGIVVTAVHKQFHHDRPLTRSLLQAQVLLCVAGAMVMIIIGNSVARAFGVAGAAGIVRFRTPVEDPKDTTLLFLLVALGMACGVGQLEVAGLGTVFLCCVLAALDRIGEPRNRTMILSVVASGKDFPDEHVQRILGVL